MLLKIWLSFFGALALLVVAPAYAIDAYHGADAMWRFVNAAGYGIGFGLGWMIFGTLSALSSGRPVAPERALPSKKALERDRTYETVRCNELAALHREFAKPRSSGEGL